MPSNQDSSSDNQDLSASSQQNPPGNNSASSPQNSPSNNSAKSQNRGLSNWSLALGGLTALIVALGGLIAAMSQLDQQTGFFKWVKSFFTRTDSIPIVEKPPNLKEIFPHFSSNNSDNDPDVVRSDGSNSMVTMMRDIQREIKEDLKHDISLSFGDKNLKPQGSQEGIELLKAKRIHLAAFSGIIPDDDVAVVSKGKLPENIKQKALIAIPIARDAIAVLVDKNNSVKSLTVGQLKGIYTCEITNWSFLGGKDVGIKVINRHSSSGTRGAFQSLVLPDQEFCSNTNLPRKKDSSFENWYEDETAEVLKKLGANGIYYASVSQARFRQVKSLPIGGIEPTWPNIFEDRYPLERKLYLVARKDASNKVIKVIDFVISSRGQEIVGRNHFPVYQDKD